MPKADITINVSPKRSSIALSERTKRMLESRSIGKETHEEIILRLIKNDTSLATAGTAITTNGNVVGTEYQRTHSTLHVRTPQGSYDVVCVYNDLNIFSTLKLGTNLKMDIPLKGGWELDLDIVNIRREGKDWEDPKIMGRKSEEFLLLYLASLKSLLEEAFLVRLYEIDTAKDYLDEGKWDQAYQRLGLSLDSLHHDVRAKLLGGAWRDE